MPNVDHNARQRDVNNSKNTLRPPNAMTTLQEFLSCETARGYVLIGSINHHRNVSVAAANSTNGAKPKKMQHNPKGPPQAKKGSCGAVDAVGA